MITDTEEQPAGAEASLATFSATVAEAASVLLSGEMLSDEIFKNLNSQTNKFATLLQLDNVFVPESDSENQCIDITSYRHLVFALFNLKKIIENKHQSDLEFISSSFGVAPADDAFTLIQEIKTSLNITNNSNSDDNEEEDKDINLVDQILARQNPPNDDSLAQKISELLGMTNEGNSTVDEIVENVTKLKQGQEEAKLALRQMKKDLDDLTSLAVSTSLNSSSASSSGANTPKKHRSARKSQIQSLTLSLLSEEQIDEYERRISTEKEEKNLLLEKVNELKSQIKRLDDENDDLKHGIDLLKVQVDTPLTSSKSLSCSEDIARSVNIISDQIQRQQDEINGLANQRNVIIEAYSKQTKVIDSLIDELHKSSSRKNDDNFTNTMTEREAVLPSFLDESSRELFDSIAEIIATSSSSVVDDILEISRDFSLPTSEKIKQIVIALINELKTKASSTAAAKVDTTTFNEERILAQIHAQLNFIERLANSDQDRQWFMPSLNNTSSLDDEFNDNSHNITSDNINGEDNEARDALLKEAYRIHHFLSKYTRGVMEDKGLFDFIALNDDDPLALQDHLKSFLDHYSRVTTNEGRELYAMLRQAFTACDVLRSYGTETNKMIELFKSENKRLEIDNQELRDEIQDIRESHNEEDLAEIKRLSEELGEVAEKNEASETLIQRIVLTLKESVIEGNSLPVILDAINQVDRAVNPVDDDEYKESIEKQLAAATNQLEEAYAQLAEVNNNIQEFSEIKATNQSMNEEATVILTDQKIQLENAQAEIASMKNDIKGLNEDLNDAQRLIDDLRAQLAEEKNLSQSQSNDLKTELESAKKRMDKRVAKVVMAIKEKEKEKRLQITQRLYKIRNERQGLIDQLNERDRQVKVLEQAQVTLVSEQKTKILKMRENEVKDQKTILALKEQVNDLTMKNTAAELEKKVVSQKLKGFDEKNDRNRIELNSVRKVLDAEYALKLEEGLKKNKDEYDNKHNRIIGQICSEFKECFEVPNSTTDDVTVKVVKAAAEMIKSISSDRRAATKQLKELQNLFSASNASEVSKAAQAYVAENKATIESLKQQLETKNSPQYASKEWESWAKKLHCSINNGQTIFVSIAAVKKGLEDAILASANARFVRRRMDSLRAQKIIYKNHLLDIHNANTNRLNKPISILPVFLSIAAINRIQRVSGTLPYKLFFNKKEEVEPAQLEIQNLLNEEEEEIGSENDDNEEE